MRAFYKSNLTKWENLLCSTFYPTNVCCVLLLSGGFLLVVCPLFKEELNWWPVSSRLLSKIMQSPWRNSCSLLHQQSAHRVSHCTAYPAPCTDCSSHRWLIPLGLQMHSFAFLHLLRPTSSLYHNTAYKHFYISWLDIFTPSSSLSSQILFNESILSVYFYFRLINHNNIFQ